MIDTHAHLAFPDFEKAITLVAFLIGDELVLMDIVHHDLILEHIRDVNEQSE